MALAGPEAAISRHLVRVRALLDEIDLDALGDIAQVLRVARSSKRTVFTMGNGGSAATAMHFVTDLLRMTRQAKPALRLRCLNSNPSTVSAVANDFGYERIFVHQLEQWHEPGDVVFAISASGNSPNCVEALKWGAAHGAINVGLLGFDGGLMKSLCHHSAHLPCHDYPAVEDLHMVIAHALANSVAESDTAPTPTAEAPRSSLAVTEPRSPEQVTA